jgi:hypothetical protein
MIINHELTWDRIQLCLQNRLPGFQHLKHIYSQFQCVWWKCTSSKDLSHNRFMLVLVTVIYWHPNLETLSGLEFSQDLLRTYAFRDFATQLQCCLIQHASFSFTFCIGHVILCIPQIVCFSSEKLSFGLFWYISVLIKYSCNQLSEMNFAITSVFPMMIILRQVSALAPNSFRCSIND